MTSAVAIAREPPPAIARLRSAVEQALEGKPDAVELALVALLARGHVLIEDVPGVGKTTLARALAKAVGGELRRVQFTSDLLPSDVLGVSRLRPARAASSSSARGRSSPTSSSPTRSTAPARAPSRRCSRR